MLKSVKQSLLTAIILCMALTTMVFGETLSGYEEIRVTKTQSYSCYDQSPTTAMVVEGRTGEAWEIIPNDNASLKFKSFGPVVNIDSFGQITGNTSGTAKIAAFYTNPDGTVLSDDIRMIFTHYKTTADWTLESFESNANKTNVQVRSGAYSYPSTAQYDKYPPNMGNMYITEMWFYDDMITSSGGVATNNDAGNATNRQWYLIVGVDGAVSSDSYYYKDTIASVDSHISGVKRSKGWHQVVADPSNFNKLNLYLDGVLIYTKAVTTQFTSGMFLLRGLKTSGTDLMYYDDFNVFKNTDGRPIAYNVKIENAVCNQAVKSKNLIASYDFYAPCREEGDTQIRWRNTDWSYQTAWASAKAGQEILLSLASLPKVNDIWLRVQPVSTATSIDYQKGPESISETITMVGDNAGVNKELVFVGKDNLAYRDITDSGLIGESKIIARYKILNNTASGYNSLFIGAQKNAGLLESLKYQNIAVPANDVATVDIEFDVIGNTVLDVFNWSDWQSISPKATKTTYDYLGIQ